jgi:hypothetical protein
MSGRFGFALERHDHRLVALLLPNLADIAAHLVDLPHQALHHVLEQATRGDDVEQAESGKDIVVDGLGARPFEQGAGNHVEEQGHGQRGDDAEYRILRPVAPAGVAVAIGQIEIGYAAQYSHHDHDAENEQDVPVKRSVRSCHLQGRLQFSRHIFPLRWCAILTRLAPGCRRPNPRRPRPPAHFGDALSR